MRKEMKVTNIEQEETVTLTDGNGHLFRIIPDHCGQFAVGQTVPVEVSAVPSEKWELTKVLA